MKVLVSGSTGLIGGVLCRRLESAGHEICRLVRADAATNKGEVAWDPATGRIDTGALARLDAVVHLAGENIAQGRWTVAKKQRIRSSRVAGTRLLCDALASLKDPPATLLSASAVGYYGDRGDTLLDETSLAGEGFLAEVCQQWEAATVAASTAGIRTVLLRTGVVLCKEGGALAKMLPLFRMGLGGPVGSGQQFMSWITLSDLVRAIEHLLLKTAISGPVNLTAPEPVTNRQFAATLGRTLHRPALLPAPAWLLRLMLGEVADGLLLSGARVLPRRLLEVGFSFEDASLETALRRLC